MGIKICPERQWIKSSLQRNLENQRFEFLTNLMTGDAGSQTYLGELDRKYNQIRTERAYDCGGNLLPSSMSAVYVKGKRQESA